MPHQEGEYHGGKVLYEEAFPNILFAIDGEKYDFDDYQCIVIGGAYSVDKYYRLSRGWRWWPDEQPDEEIKRKVETNLDMMGNRIDYRKWYCGHYHTRKSIDKVQFMFEDFDVISVKSKKSHMWQIG